MNGSSDSCSLRSLKNPTDILTPRQNLLYTKRESLVFNAFVVLLKVSPKKCHRIKCLLYAFSIFKLEVKGSSNVVHT